MSETTDRNVDCNPINCVEMTFMIFTSLKDTDVKQCS